MKQYLLRFKNVGTIMALVGLCGMLANQLGYSVDTKWLSDTANIACGILIVLGVCNNPETPGLDLPN
ncbi:MAG: hypothetical protein ACRC68_13510 [Clostridium sp.]